MSAEGGSTAEKTEPASPRKRKRAREEGQVAKSSEIIGCLLLLAVLQMIPTLGAGMAESTAAYSTQMLRVASQRELSPDALIGLAADGLRRVALLAGPLLGTVMLASLTGAVAQVGLVFTPSKLMPKWSVINPLEGFKRMFKPRTLVELAKGLVKVVVVSYVGGTYLRDHWQELFSLGNSHPSLIAPQIGMLAHAMALRMTGALTVVAALDYVYQRWDLEKNLKMTRQEVKDEMKDSEGNPQIKGQIRQRMREFSRKRMMSAVPTATVIITNPTHYSIALKYDLGQPGAPRVVAKGKDLLALRIRTVAKEHGVPLVENRPLARALYASVKVGQEIPADLFRAVAEVLAYVWRTGENAGTR